MNRTSISLTAALLSLCLFLTGCMMPPGEGTATSFSLEDIPAYAGDPYVVIDGNQPDFSEEDRTSTESFETYSPLDALGRCGVAYANIGQDLMPTEDRESISSVTPTGWINKQYDGEYLYNRCHLIGFQLAGENANEENLITGTRYMNTEGMLPFEDEVADYVHETGNHVLYRVTPVFEGDEVVARGVQIEAESVEDGGAGVSFNVYCYNVQPGVEIDYTTGENREADDAAGEIAAAEEEASGAATSAGAGATDDGQPHGYVLNTRSRKFHLPDCDGAADMSGRNRDDVTCTRDELIGQGYEPCGRCNP